MQEGGKIATFSEKVVITLQRPDYKLLLDISSWLLEPNLSTRVTRLTQSETTEIISEPGILFSLFFLSCVRVTTLTKRLFNIEVFSQC